MNFKLGRIFYLIISCIIGAFFFACGLVGIILPWFPSLQYAIIHFILANTIMLSLFGLGFILIGLSIVLYAIFSSRRQYIHVRTGMNSVSVDKNVIHSYLEAYWKEHFPHAHILFNVTLNKNSVQIVADLPAMPEKDKNDFLSRLESDLNDLFGRLIGCPQDIHLFATFEQVHCKD